MRRSKKKFNEASIELKFKANLLSKISPLFMKMRDEEEQQNLGIVLCITGILDCKFINVAEDSLVVLENFQKDFCMNVDALANVRSLVLILHL